MLLIHSADEKLFQMNLTAQSNQSGKLCFNYKPECTEKASVQLSDSGARRLQLAKRQNHSQRPRHPPRRAGLGGGGGAMPPVSSQPRGGPSQAPSVRTSVQPQAAPPFQPRRGITDSSSQKRFKGLLSVTFSGTSVNILSICPHSQSREKPAT